MYISEISKSKISDFKSRKKTILLTLEVRSAIMEDPVCMFAFLFVFESFKSANI